MYKKHCKTVKQKVNSLSLLVKHLVPNKVLQLDKLLTIRRIYVIN